jgi:hypothetical protein
VAIIRPDPDVVAAGGRSWRVVMDMACADATYAAAHAQGVRLAPHLAEIVAAAGLTPPA